MPVRTNYFSLQLSKLLTALGKSQKELAVQTNISESKLSKLQSGKLEPKHKDIQKIADALKVSPGFFFKIKDHNYPIEIGYILDNRIYSVLYNNPNQNILILMGRTLETHSVIPEETMTFLTNLNENNYFSITLISGNIQIGNKPIKKHIPYLLDQKKTIEFQLGSVYILQIIGDSNKFIQLLQNYLPPEKFLKI